MTSTRVLKSCSSTDPGSSKPRQKHHSPRLSKMAAATIKKSRVTFELFCGDHSVRLSPFIFLVDLMSSHPVNGILHITYRGKFVLDFYSVLAFFSVLNIINCSL